REGRPPRQRQHARRRRRTRRDRRGFPPSSGHRPLARGCGPARSMGLSHRRACRGGDRRRPAYGGPQPDQVHQSRAGSHARPAQGRPRDGKGARLMSATNQESTKTYEREAEATRNRLSASLDELATSLTPGTMLDEVLTYARAGGADFLRGLGKSASSNPIPTLLIGLGAAMFLTGRGRVDGSRNGNGHGAGVLRHAAAMMRGRTRAASDYGEMAAGEAYRAGPAYRTGRPAGSGVGGVASGVGRAATST